MTFINPPAPGTGKHYNLLNIKLFKGFIFSGCGESCVIDLLFANVYKKISMKGGGPQKAIFI